MQAFIGQILTFAGNFVPVGWLACDGSLVSISDYDSLYSLIGTTYGGDGVQRFALPNLSSRVAIHQGSATSGTNYPLGAVGGTTSVTLTQDNLPAHGHPLNVTSQTSSGTPGSQLFVADQNGGKTSAYFASTTTNLTAMSNSSIGSAGGSGPHNNVQPSLAVTYGICVDGLYPPFD